MQILDGKAVSLKLQQKIVDQIEQLKTNGKRIPRLDVIIVGNDYGSIKYVEMKEKKALELGIIAKVHHLQEETTTGEVEKLINSLNKDNTVDGIMVQLPLPKHINTNQVLQAIDPSKDVDGLTPTNLGKLFQKDLSGIAPATPVGIMELLDHYSIDIYAKNVVILGSSNIIGVPLSAMMLEKKATVTLCNQLTEHISEISKHADILVSATGKPKLVGRNFVKNGSVVIDVGSNKDPQTGKLVGDVNFEEVDGIPEYITPVPGGVGPMTIISLILNLMKCYNAR